MGFYISFLFLIIAIIEYRNNHTFFSPSVFFLALWSLISIFTALELSDFYQVTFFTWIIVLFGGVSFFIGTVIASKSKIVLLPKRLSKNKVISVKDKYVKSRKLFWFLMTILLICSLYDLYESYRMMGIGYSLAELHGEINTSNESGPIVLIKKIIAALRTVLIAQGVYLTIFSKNRDNKPLLASFMITIMTSFSSGGRFGLVYLMIEIFACLSLEQQKFKSAMDTYSNERRPSKTIYVFIGGILLATVFAVTILRGKVGDEIFDHLYVYICGDVTLLDQLIPFLESAEWSYGMASLYGLTTIIFPVLHFFGVPYPDLYLDCAPIIEQTIFMQKIGAQSYMNAFVTSYYYLYADFRIVGVILGMAIFGNVAQGYYNRAKKNVSDFDIVIYLVVIQMIFKSLQQYYLSSSDYVIILLVAFIARKFKFNFSKQ